MEEDKRCENCKYFIQYYYKKGLAFHTVLSGHCIRKRVTAAALNSRKEGCGHWEPGNAGRDKAVCTVTAVLSDVYGRLESIEKLLEKNVQEK